MASITSWIRVEPDCRSTTLQPGLEAQTHDGLWFLARQWQLGELTGQDLGSAVQVQVRGELVPLGGELPIGVAIEATPRNALAGAGPTLLDRLETGRRLARMLVGAGLPHARDALLARYRVVANGDEVDASARLLRVMSAGRVIDGAAAYAELAPLVVVPGDLTLDLGVPASDVHAMTAVVRRWVATATLVEPSDSAWDRTRFEYHSQTNVALSDRDAQLVAAEYDGGGVDWHSFDVAATATANRPRAGFVRTVHPTGVSYRGAPARRYWEIEDASVDLGALSAPAGDLPRMLLSEFALLYGGDWHVAPVQIPFGSVVRIDSVVVTDTFGYRTLVPAYHQDPKSTRWRMFAASGANDLLVLPARPRVLEGSPVEEVDLLRDEAANLVWGVERRIERADGTTLELSTDAPVRRPPDLLTYGLAIEPPPHWIPLQPTGQDRRALVPAALVHAGTVTPTTNALGEILHAPTIADEEVPGEGIRVARVFRFTRTAANRPLLWIAHCKRPGAEPVASGVRFDVIEP